MGDRASSPGSKLQSMAFTATVIAAVPILCVFVLPKLLFLVGAGLGWILLRQTQGRKSHILAIMNDDDKAFREQHGDPLASAEVKAFADGASKASNDTNKDWDGIVGFFHPFW